MKCKIYDVFAFTWNKFTLIVADEDETEGQYAADSKAQGSAIEAKILWCRRHDDYLEVASLGRASVQ